VVSSKRQTSRLQKVGDFKNELLDQIRDTFLKGKVKRNRANRSTLQNGSSAKEEKREPGKRSWQDKEKAPMEWTKKKKTLGGEKRIRGGASSKEEERL